MSADHRPQPSVSEGLADVLEPVAPPSYAPPSAMPIVDMAFADTVIVRGGADEPIPPSGPIIVSDHTGNTQCVKPLAYPLPPAASLPLPERVAARVERAVRTTTQEMRDLWAGTGQALTADETASLSPARVFARRMRVLWSFWEWDRHDLVRAGIIGLVVFFAIIAITVVRVTTSVKAEVSSGRTPTEERL